MNTNLEPSHVLVPGRSGSGKTIFVRRLVLNATGVACSFVFDWNDRFTYDWQGRKLPLHSCYSIANMNAALSSRLVIYNPSRDFPGCRIDRKIGREALRHFCRYVRTVCQGTPGRKLVCCAEIWNFCNEDSIPAEMAMLADDGRGDRIEFVFDTQHPELLNQSISGAAIEVVCFNLQGKALKAVSGLMHDPEAVGALPMGSFISRTIQGGMIQGRVF